MRSLPFSIALGTREIVGPTTHKCMIKGNMLYYTFSYCSAASGPPPSYYDVMGISQMKNDIGAARKDSKNPAIMIFKVCCICIGSCKLSSSSSVPMLLCMYCSISDMHCHGLCPVWGSAAFFVDCW